MSPKTTTQILAQLRKLMADKAKRPLAAYIVPSRDQHNSEYIAARDERRAFVSGFTGSAGVAVVTADKALLWTDGRYHAQAEAEMDHNWTLIKEGLPEAPSQGEWLCANLDPGSAVGVDPFLMAQTEYASLSAKLKPEGIDVLSVAENLVDRVWDGQPAYPENEVFPLDVKFSGESWQSKVKSLRSVMSERGVSCLVLSALDEVAWLYNLRGSDIKFNPVFFAYAAVTADEAHLFISDKQASPAVRSHLESVHLHPYSDIKTWIENYAAEQSNSNNHSEKERKPKKIWFSNYESQGLVSVVPETRRLSECTPVAMAKAIKNETEIAGIVASHIRDAAALCRYFAWLEANVPSGTVDEISGAAVLQQYRSEMQHFVGLSFETISSVGPNGAVIHYRPAKDTCRTLTTSEIYLVDSGAQYKDGGTTDVTRTMHFGTPSDHERECYTRVLKGHIRLATTVFPSKLKGNCLDSFARSSLWEVGLDYLHGTGHGVGSYLNVHEGPMGISWRPYPDDPGLVPNMILSNEPGYYETGKFGIRIENLVRVVKAETKHNFANRGFLTFKNVTLVPYQRRMIDPKMLSSNDVAYLNEYNDECREKVGSLLRELGHKDALQWLLRETEPIG